METICSSHKSLYRNFLPTRPNRLGEPPPVSLLLWSRGGLVIETGTTFTIHSIQCSLIYIYSFIVFLFILSDTGDLKPSPPNLVRFFLTTSYTHE